MTAIALLLATVLSAQAQDPEPGTYPEDAYRLVALDDTTWVHREVPAMPKDVISGKCIVRVFVDETGAPTEVGWYRCRSERLQDPVEAAVMASRWEPYVSDGSPLKVQFQAVYRFPDVAP